MYVESISSAPCCYHPIQPGYAFCKPRELILVHLKPGVMLMGYAAKENRPILTEQMQIFR
jgi:hypothetical protein